MAGNQERSVFGKNLRAWREHNGLTQPQVAERIGVTVQSENKWENQGIQPRRKVIDDIIAAFGLSEDDLLSDSGGFYARLHGLAGAPAGAVAVSTAPGRSVPIATLGAVHAGDADEPWAFDGDEVAIMSDMHERHPRCFALEVNGDCMDRVFTQSDVILVDPDMEPHDGSIAVILADGQTVVRRVRMGSDSMMLVSESHAPHPDIFVGPKDEARCLGCVFWWQSRKERF